MALIILQRILHTHLLLALIFLSTSSCATIPGEFAYTSSIAYETPETTITGKIFSDLINTHPGKSGFLLLETGEEAFMVRSTIKA